MYNDNEFCKIVMMVLQLFLSTECLGLAAFWLSILKTFEGLSFPFDFFNSFSPSFCNSEERRGAKNAAEC